MPLHKDPVLRKTQPRAPENLSSGNASTFKMPEVLDREKQRFISEKLDKVLHFLQDFNEGCKYPTEETPSFLTRKERHWLKKKMKKTVVPIHEKFQNLLKQPEPPPGLRAIRILLQTIEEIRKEYCKARNTDLETRIALDEGHAFQTKKNLLHLLVGCDDYSKVRSPKLELEDYWADFSPHHVENEARRLDYEWAAWEKRKSGIPSPWAPGKFQSHVRREEPTRPIERDPFFRLPGNVPFLDNTPPYLKPWSREYEEWKISEEKSREKQRHNEHGRRAASDHLRKRSQARDSVPRSVPNQRIPTLAERKPSSFVRRWLETQKFGAQTGAVPKDTGKRQRAEDDNLTRVTPPPPYFTPRMHSLHGNTSTVQQQTFQEPMKRMTQQTTPSYNDDSYLQGILKDIEDICVTKPSESTWRQRTFGKPPHFEMPDEKDAAYPSSQEEKSKDRNGDIPIKRYHDNLGPHQGGAEQLRTAPGSDPSSSSMSSSPSSSDSNANHQRHPQGDRGGQRLPGSSPPSSSPSSSSDSSTSRRRHRRGRRGGQRFRRSRNGPQMSQEVLDYIARQAQAEQKKQDKLTSLRWPDYYLSLSKPWNVIPDRERARGEKDYMDLLQLGTVAKFNCTKLQYHDFRDTFITFVHRLLITVNEKLILLESAIEKRDPHLMNYFKHSGRGPATYKGIIEQLEEHYGSAVSRVEESRRNLQELPPVGRMDLNNMRKLTTALSSYKVVCADYNQETGTHCFTEVFNKLDRSIRTSFMDMEQRGVHKAELDDLHKFCLKLQRNWNRVEDYESKNLERPKERPRVTHLSDLKTSEAPSAQFNLLEDANCSNSAVNETQDLEEREQQTNLAIKNTVHNFESILEQSDDFDLVPEEYVARMTAKDDPCFLCHKEHLLRDCPKLKALSPGERLKLIAKDLRCFRCLKKGHGRSACPSKVKCRECGELHNTLLHGVDKRPVQRQQTAVQQTSVRVTAVGKIDESAKDMTAFHPTECPITPVRLATLSGETTVVVNGLLDGGASHTLLSRKVAEELGLSGPESETTVSLALGQKAKSRQMLSKCRVILADGQPYVMRVKIVDQPCGGLYPVDWNRWKTNYPHLTDIEFPKIDVTQEVELLIGASDTFIKRHLCIDVTGNSDEPIAYKTPLGWICEGAVPKLLNCGLIHGNQMHCHRVQVSSADSPQKNMQKVRANLNQALQIGGLPKECYQASKTLLDKLSQKVAEDRLPDLTCEEEDYELSTEEKRCIELMTSKRIFKDGRYFFPVLWKENEPKLTKNLGYVKQRMERNEAALQKVEGAWQKYNDILTTYEQKGYIEEIKDSEKGKFFLPHFAVIREDKSTTKVRVVFDGRARGSGRSLNDAVSAGPKLIQDLPSVLLRFRQYPVALAGDLAEMFLQIGMFDYDSEYHHFVHRMGPGESVREFAWKRHTFGNAGSPCVAMAAVRMHAEEHEKKFPAAAEAVRHCSLVDDTLTSYKTPQEAIAAFKEMQKLFTMAGMQIRKFISNSPEVLEAIPSESREARVDFHTIGETGGDINDITTKTLGVRYFPVDDYFQFKLELDQELKRECAVWTKRKYLIVYSRLFDPLGLLAPFTIVPRLLFHQLVRAGVEWDENLPECKEWNAWLHSAEEHLQHLRIPRCLMPITDETWESDLHVFMDASSDAIGVAIYLRTQGKNGVAVRLVAGKSKLAQIKAVSVPRLELTACELGVKLAHRIKKTLNVEKTTYYTDSQAVLWWMTIQHRRLQVFVANRVHKILLYTEREEWRYVETSRNPADLPTKGMLADALCNSRLWLEGPDFLKTGEEPAQPTIEPSEEASKELRKNLKDLTVNTLGVPVVLQMDLDEKDMENTKWIDLVHKHMKGTGEPSEFIQTEMAIILEIQQKKWPEVFEGIRKNGQIMPTHKLSFLNPLPDEYGVLRVNGRLKHASMLDLDVRCPILIPGDMQIAVLIVRDIHERQLQHGMGPDHLLSMIHQRFWFIPGARKIAKEVLGSCTRCQYRKAEPKLATEAPLPDMRIPGGQRVAAFEVVGIDAAGPWSVTRGRGTEKRYVLLFVCMSYSCIHIEKMSEMSTQSFLQALRRFIARRGCPRIVCSDNGTNFVSGWQIIKKISSADKDNEIRMAFPEIEWQFNSPLSPHQGGIWERQIRTMKRLLQQTMTSAQHRALSLQDEELGTLLTVAEGIMNSKPLSYVSSSFEDYEPLTPAHFLHGGPFVDLSFKPSTNEQGGWTLGKKFAKIESLLDFFWKRYILEVLPGKNRLNKHWITNRESLAVGDVVIVFEEGLRGRFPIGRVLDVLENKKDKVARSADVLVNGKVYRRSLTRLRRLFSADELDAADCSEIPEVPVMPKNWKKLPKGTGPASYERLTK